MKHILRISISKSNKSILLLMMVLLMLSPTTVFSNTVVNNTVELEEALGNAVEGDIIALAEEFTFADATLTMPMVNVTIDGENKIWNEGVIKVTGNGEATGSLTIRNLKIDGTMIAGKLLSNGAANGKLILEDMELYKGTAGALDISTASEAMTIINRTKIYENVATNAAPAIWLGINANVEINFSTIENNLGTGAGYETGAISSKNYRAKLVINNSVFRKNKNTSLNTGVVGGGGGAMAIHYFYGEIAIDNSIFDANESSPDVSKTNDGGAIYILDGRDGATFDINNSTFMNNIAYGDGGAVYVQGTGNPGLTTTIANSTFYNNRALCLNEEELASNIKHGGGAIVYFKNGGSSKMTNTVLSSTFVQNIAGNEGATKEVRGGAIGLSGAGLFATAAITRNANLFLENQVYGINGEINAASNYKDLSNYATEQAGTLNILNVQKGLSPSHSTESILGINNVMLTENLSNIKAGVDNEPVMTIPIKPESIADNTYSGTATTPATDQRHNPRSKDQGAVEMSWIKYDVNGGAIGLDPLAQYDGTHYYEPDSTGVTKTYYSIGAIDGDSFIVDPDSTLKAAKEGYVVLGWSTDPDATTPEEAYAVNAPIKYLQENFTLYAIWGIQHTVTFEPEGGMFSDSTLIAKTVAILDSELVTEETIEREDHIFIGWFTNLTDTVPYDFTTPVTEDITLYAKWEQIVYHRIDLETPEVDCYDFTPLTGNYKVKSGECFSLDIIHDTSCESLLYVFTVYVNGEIIEPKADNGVTSTYEVCDIQEDLQIVVVAEEAPVVSIDETTGETDKIWSENGLLLIESDKATLAHIYNATGQLVAQVTLNKGRNEIALTDGFYVVRLDNKTTKKVIVSKK